MIRSRQSGARNAERSEVGDRAGNRGRADLVGMEMDAPAGDATCERVPGPDRCHHAAERISG